MTLNLNRLLILLVVFFINLFSLVSASQSLKSPVFFQQISLNEGLSHCTVNDAVQDQQGCIWIGTASGLNKYDGTKFRIYRHDQADSLTLLSNTVNSLLIDSKANLWVCVVGGLAKYDNSINKFKNFICQESGNPLRVTKLLEWSAGEYFVGTNLGVFSFSETDGYKRISVPTKSLINTLCKVGPQLLVGAEDGLFCYLPQKRTCITLNPFFKSKDIRCLLPIQKSKEQLWVGTEGSGLVLYDRVNNSIKTYQHDKNNTKSISSNYVRSLAYDSKGRLWAGTFVGLNILNQSSGEFATYYNNYSTEGALSNNSIRNILCDSQGGMWCGTFYGGLNYYHPLKNQFEHIHSEPGVNSLNDNVVSCMLETAGGKIWIGTNDQGLDLFDPQTKKFSYFKSEESNPNSFRSNNIKALLPDESGNLYVATHGGGLNYFDVNSFRSQRINISTNIISNSNVYALAKVDGMIWVGTLNGIVLYNPKTKSCVALEQLIPKAKLLKKQVLSLLIDSKKRLWIGTENGVAVYFSKSRQLEFVKSAVPDFLEKKVHCLYEDEKHQIFFGTTEGLFSYNEKSHLLISESNDKTDFSNYSIFGIQSDKSKRLWISTNGGLICYSRSKAQMRVYTESDGIQSNQFNPYSSCKTRDGKMYFGGINGLTAFYPDRLIDNPYTPPVLISDLKIFNKSVAPGDETGVLSENIVTTKKLKLKAKFAQFGLEFVAPNYLAGQKTKFAYKLEGFDEDWYYTDQHSVSYSNLNPGTYTFKIKASNNNDKWGTQLTELEIVILPHWWETWWAIIIFLFIILYIANKINQFFIDKKLISKELALERLEKEKEKELNEMKIRFFINVSHEFRTPLTLILSPLQEVLQKGIPDKWAKEQLEYALRNARSMLRLVNQVLDYRKVDQGAMQLRVSNKEVSNFARSIFDLFNKMAVQKKIQYVFESSLNGRLIWYDANYVERIISNILSNAFKYTPEGGTITLKLSEEKNNLVLEVCDTGAGIPVDKQALVFEEFFQVDEHTKGSGIGLSLVKRLVNSHHGEIGLISELGKGSTFRVQLPLFEAAYGVHEKKLVVLDTPSKQELPQLTEVEIEVVDSVEVLNASEVVETLDMKTILLVEDDVEIRTYLTTNLRSHFKIIPVENGQLAWDFLATEVEVDLIISDVMMPVMDGMKLCKLVKSNFNTCHIPLILLTAKTDVDDQLAGLNLGADDYVGKPFVFSLLQAKVINLFKTKQRLLQRYSTTLEVEPEKIAFNPMDEEMLKKAVEVVERNMENCDFSAEEFSRDMNMSRSNLHLKLKALTGESAIDFIRRIRFGYACKLLKEGRYNGAEISTMVGFSSPAYFTTSFKKFMGCLPSEYVKNN